MRIIIAMMKHETNTFSPVPTNLERFARGQTIPYQGVAAYDAYQGTGSGISAFIDLSESEKAEIILPIAANAWPSGPVHDDAYEYICNSI